MRGWRAFPRFRFIIGQEYETVTRRVVLFDENVHMRAAFGQLFSSISIGAAVFAG
jgi:hypothetical protein